MYDKNHCKFSGTIQDFKRIDTRTGTPMVSFKLKCWKKTIKVVAFQELAESTSLTDGGRVEVVGKLQSSSWEYEGQKYHGFQIVADSICAIETNKQERQQREKNTPKSVLIFEDSKPKYAEFGQRPVATFDQGEPF